jgi:phage-related protein
MKPVAFLGDSLDRLRAFPDNVRRKAGHQLERLQYGGTPDDWKPMQTIGAGVQEVRVRGRSGAFRVIYVARFAEAIYVLHAFQKKANKTPALDLELARTRYAQLVEDRR